jgi:peptide/nickel transport system substrate-binding protein
MTKSTSVEQISGLVYEGLFKRMPDMSMSPQLARNYTVSDNALTYTFALRDDVKWHDGSAFTANDVEYTIREIIKNDCIYKHNVENIAATKVISSTSYSVTLKQPMVGFVALMSFPVVKNGTIDTAALATYMPMGTGYYRYVEGHIGKTLTLKSVGNHWSGKTANIETVIVRELPDKDAVKYSFDASEVDVMHQTFSEMLAYSPKQAERTVNFAGNNITFLGINANKDMLAGANTRKAISMALDREYIAGSVLVNRVTPALLPIKPDSWLMPEEYRDVAKKIDAARELLAEDAWEAGDNGLMQRTSGSVTTMLQFSVIVNEDNARRIAVLESARKNLSDIGVVMTVDKLSFDEYKRRVSARDYDMFIGEITISEENDLSVFGGTAAAYCAGSGASFDVLLDNIRRAKNDEDVKNGYAALAQGFADEMPIITLFFSMDAIVCNSKIRGSLLPAYGNIYSNIADWYAN